MFSPQGKVLWSHFAEFVQNCWGGITCSLRKDVVCLIFYLWIPCLEMWPERTWGIILSVWDFQLRQPCHTASKPTEPKKSTRTYSSALPEKHQTHGGCILQREDACTGQPKVMGWFLIVQCRCDLSWVRTLLARFGAKPRFRFQASLIICCFKNPDLGSGPSLVLENEKKTGQ